MARKRPRWLLVALVTLAAVLGCRKETIDKPDAPSMADVIEAFGSPNGTFDASTAGAVRSRIDGAVNGLLGAGVADRLFTAVEDAIREQGSGKSQTRTRVPAPAAAPELASSVAPRAFEDDGFGRITRICDGWGSEPAPNDADNGHLTLTFTFAQTRIDPVIWGDVERCLYLVGGKRLRLDRGAAADALRLYIGEYKTLEDLRATPIILALDLTATLDDERVDSKLAVRFTYKTAEVELLVPVVDGSVVVMVSGSSALRVRAKNGTFQCDVATRLCKDNAGGEVAL